MKGMSSRTADSVQVVSHSRSQVAVPEMKEGMSFGDFKDLVDKWDLVSEVPDNKKAVQLVMKLPLKDNFGGIQRAVRHKFTNEDLTNQER